MLDKVHEGCSRRGLITGIHVASVEYARGMIDKGFQFVTLLSDGRLLATAAKEGVDRIKGARHRRQGRRAVLRRSPPRACRWSDQHLIGPDAPTRHMQREAIPVRWASHFRMAVQFRAGGARRLG